MEVPEFGGGARPGGRGVRNWGLELEKVGSLGSFTILVMTWV